MLLYLFLAVYFCVLITVFIYASHRYYMLYLYYRYQKNKPEPKEKFESLPRITIQLPVYNEVYVVKRLISAACEIDYPKELIDVQVLDDSTDDTNAIARETVAYFKKQGFDIHYIHRKNRTGLDRKSVV